jgi:hypothetical protein
MESTKKVITKLADLEPVFEKDHFICMFTGHFLDSAYLIAGKYGSFYDPIIAATYIQSRLGDTISKEHFLKFQELIAKDTGDQNAPFFRDISTGSTVDFCPGGAFEELLYNHLKFFGDKFKHCIVDSSEYSKLKEKKKPRKKSTEHQSNLYMYTLADEKLSDEKTIQTNQMIDLSVLFPGLKATVVNTRPGNIQIYLSNSDPPEINPQANSLIGKYLVSETHKGTVVIISKTPVS